MKEDFVFVDEFVPGIRWDAKYATWDNFVGKPVDGYLVNRIVGTRVLCAALERAQEQAASLGFGLLLWDGYRPQRAVDCAGQNSRRTAGGSHGTIRTSTGQSCSNGDMSPPGRATAGAAPSM